MNTLKHPTRLRKLALCLVAGLCVSSIAGISLAAQETNSDWSNWRGPTHDGIAPQGTTVPTTWSPTEKIAWRSPIIGTGHGSPIIAGRNVVIATADLDKQIQALVCLDRESGETQWTCIVHQNGLKKEGNTKTSLASSTPVWDGERYYCNFLNSGAIYASAVDASGNLVWSTKISDYVVHQGYGSSPFIYGDLVLIASDNKGGGAFAGLNRRTGEIVWRFERPAKPNYVSPIVYKLDGRDQLLLIGCDEVVSLDPANGSVLWQMEGATTECVTTTVTDGAHIYTSGGYPRNHVSAIVADGSKRIAWENDTRIYVPSMIVSEGYLYAVADAGVLYCWNAATGEEMWKERLGGTFSSSPILVGNRLYAMNEGCETFVVEVSPQAAKTLSVNRLGDTSYASPAVSGDRLFLRVTEMIDGTPQDVVYCLKD